MSADEIKVISFLALYAGMFIGLDAIMTAIVSWMWDHGMFWYIAAPIGTAILMAYLYG